MPKIPVLRVKEWLRQTGNSLKATAMQKTTLREIKRVSLVVFALGAIDQIWNRVKRMVILIRLRRMKMKKTVILLATVLLAVSLAGCKSSDYTEAMSMYEEGQYEQAVELFESLGDYKDSQDMILACKYEEAKSLLESADYEAAKNIFSDLGSYEDSETMVIDCDYQQGKALFEAENYKSAREIFVDLGSYKNSEAMMVECDYQLAIRLYKRADYQGAISLFETISDYRESPSMLADAKREYMYQEYADVIKLLSSKPWYYNGGSDTLLNRIVFSRKEVTLEQVEFDGNGKHTNGSEKRSFDIDEEKITVALKDGTELSIPYKVDEANITLGNGEYFTIEEIDAMLQGYWKYRGSSPFGDSEYNIFVNNGTLKTEHAAEAYGYSNGVYYYYGPHTGTYTLNFGGFDTNMQNGFFWGFNIINGKPTMLYLGHVLSPSSGLPGEDGYSF